MPGISLALVNQKGGVGKTTVALGLASAAAHAGYRVLVVDLDPQANASTGLGVWEPELTVDTALAADQPGVLLKVITAASWQVTGGRTPDVAASSPLLAQREPQLATDPIGAQDRLQVAMEGVDHDVVLIDCPPSLGLLTVNGLFAADRALVVTEPGAWASDGVQQILRTVSRVAARRAEGLGTAGIVVNRLGRTRDARYWYEQLQESYPDLVLPPVHLRTAVPEAAAQSLPIHGLGTRPGAAEAMAEFDELLRLLFPELVDVSGHEPAGEAEVDPGDAHATDPETRIGGEVPGTGDGPARFTSATTFPPGSGLPGSGSSGSVPSGSGSSGSGSPGSESPGSESPGSESQGFGSHASGSADPAGERS